MKWCENVYWSGTQPQIHASFYCTFDRSRNAEYATLGLNYSSTHYVSGTKLTKGQYLKSVRLKYICLRFL